MRVSVIVPCWNERAFIERVLASIINGQTSDLEVEVLVVDGMSTDGTREIVERFARLYPQVRLLDNQDRVVPQALNLGIKEARGEIILRMDAHAEYPHDYVGRLASALMESGADNVGGVWQIVPGAETLEAQVAAIASAHPLGVGNAHYRIGADKPIEVDTVPFGCYRREVFDRIGLFDTDMVRNQDDELNARLIASGGKILLIPSIVIRYFARPTIRQLAKMFYQYGYFKPLGNLKAGRITTMRQLGPPALVAGASLALVLGAVFPPLLPWFFACASAYLGVIGAVASREARKRRLGIAGAFLLARCFVQMHFAYGLGYLLGLFDFRLRGIHSKRKVHVASTR